MILLWIIFFVSVIDHAYFRWTSLQGLADFASNSVDKLDMNGLNRVNVLFSGCSFVTVDGLNKESTKLQTSASGANLSGTSTPVPTAAGEFGIRLRLCVIMYTFL